MIQTFSPRQYEGIISQLQSIITNLCKEKNALQAKIDSLMLEFCPEEMTQEQIENWEQHQVISTSPPPKIINMESLKQSFNDMLEKQKHMVTIPVSSELTCGDGTGTKVTVESEINRLVKRVNRQQKKTTPEFKEKMAEGFMFGANFMVVCPECGNKRCPKAANYSFKCTNSNEVGQVGEIDKELFNYDKLVITTGDDVSDIVWTEEKLEELQRFVDKINKEEQSSK